MIIYIPDIPVGKKFGRLTVLGQGHRSKTSRQWYWRCRCDCGVEKEIMGCNVRAGRTISCGCAQKEIAKTANKTHGRSGTKLHQTWKGMKQRCTNPNNPAFSDYGGRGIKMCDRWLRSFEDFAIDVGEPPSVSHSLDRIDNEVGYQPGNVKWSTITEQVRNRRISVYVEMNGRHHLKKLCDELGVDYFNAYHLIIRKKVTASVAFEILRNSKEATISNGLEESP